MLTKLMTKEGYIYGILEWEKIDDERIFIKSAWIHDNHRNNGAIPTMVKLMVKDKDKYKISKTQFVGWERTEKGKPFRWYPVYRILRRI